MAGGARAVAIVAVLLMLTCSPQSSGAEGEDSDWSFITTGAGLPGDGMYSFLETADLNGDGALDLAGASYDGEGLRVWLGDGTGGFAEASEGLPSERGYGQISLEDLDGDGRRDLIAAGTSWAGSRGIRIFLNREADGGLSWEEASSPDTEEAYDGVDLMGGLLFGGGAKGARAWRYGGGAWKSISGGLPSGEEVTGVCLARDGGRTFAAAGSYALKGIRIWELAGDRWEAVTPEQVAGETLRSQGEHPLMTDIDGDGELDLAASFGGSGSSRLGLMVWLGRGGLGSEAGMEPAGSGLPANDWFFQFSAADLDGADGKEIVAGSGKEGSGLRIWSHDGGGWYERDTGLPAEGSYYAVTTGDVDGDGTPDVISAPLREGIRVHLNPSRNEGDPGAPEASAPIIAVAAATGAVLMVVAAFIAYRIRR